MTSRVILIVLLMLAAGAARAVDPAITVQKMTADVSVDAQGSATLVHLERSASSVATAAQMGQLPIDFIPSLERLDIVNAYTRKSDGTRKVVDAAGIRAQLAPGVPNVPIVQDVQQKVVVYPDLQAGDMQVIDYRRGRNSRCSPASSFWSAS